MNNNQEIKNSYGTIRNINTKNNSKKKLYRISLIVGSVSLAVFLFFQILGLRKKYKTNELDSDQIKIVLNIDVNNGDDTFDIANKFFTDDCKEVYSSVENYEKQIIQENNMSNLERLDSINTLEEGQEIKIPIIIKSDNPYYVRILQLENEIAKLTDTNYWVNYIVESGDSIAYLASLASSSTSETVEITQKIMDKNNLKKGEILQIGRRILIVNPKLGELKNELNGNLQELVLSLQADQKAK